MSKTEIVITGLGMVSSVGHDAISACASIRAGISCPSEIDYFPVAIEDDYEIGALIGHPVTLLTNGFGILGRWICLASACIDELFWNSTLPSRQERSFWQDTVLIGVTPYVDDDRFESGEDTSPDFIRQAFVERLRNKLQLPVADRNTAAICLGHAGMIAAINEAITRIHNSDIKRALIVSVDSYLDPFSLNWLADLGRLKTESDPVGIAPGEAGTTLLVESFSEAQRRNANIQARINGISLELEANNYFTDEVNQGVGISKVMKQAIEKSGITTPFRGDVIVDLNGEPWRAREFHNARVSLHDIIDDISIITPAECVGDTGAASGGIGVCMAVHQFKRRYNKSDSILVVSSSDRGHVAAISVS